MHKHLYILHATPKLPFKSAADSAWRGPLEGFGNVTELMSPIENTINEECGRVVHNSCSILDNASVIALILVAD